MLLINRITGEAQPVDKGDFVKMALSGSQFTSEDFTSILNGQGIRISMDGEGRCMDKIFIGASVVKPEIRRGVEVYVKKYRSLRAARARFAECFQAYNESRPCESLGYKAPCEVYFTQEPDGTAETDREHFP